MKKEPDFGLFSDFAIFWIEYQVLNMRQKSFVIKTYLICSIWRRIVFLDFILHVG